MSLGLEAGYLVIGPCRCITDPQAGITAISKVGREGHDDFLVGHIIAAGHCSVGRCSRALPEPIGSGLVLYI